MQEHANVQQETAQAAFAEGDIVQLKTGGPRMVVAQATPHGHVMCLWFVGGNHLHDARIPPAALRNITAKLNAEAEKAAEPKQAGDADKAAEPAGRVPYRNTFLVPQVGDIVRVDRGNVELQVVDMDGDTVFCSRPNGSLHHVHAGALLLLRRDHMQQPAEKVPEPRQLKPGDVVRCKTGGTSTEMAIDHIRDFEQAYCRWFVGDHAYSLSFSFSDLEFVR